MTHHSKNLPLAPRGSDDAPAGGVVAAIGTINFDRIIAQNGQTYESLGGILYNGLVLAAIFEGTEHRVQLHARLGPEHREIARALFDGFPAADLGGLIPDSRGTNISRLDYSRGPDRAEDVELRVPPLRDADLDGARQANVILVNMISGQDVDRETLARLRSGSSARFFLDIQALARTLTSPRTSRSIPDWREWTALFHTVRGNEKEIASFAGCPGDAQAAARHILEAGAEEVLVTRGEEGSRRFSRVCGAIREETIAAVPRSGLVETTGCGDAYDAAVCAAWMFGLTGDDAARFASFVSSEVAGVFGLEGLRQLRGIRARAARFDPRFAVLEV
ncbi:MAG TPA: carbohydrate kinase family protein [bacterium]|nr:carbohydrate kinase family protein [bacterium]